MALYAGMGDVEEVVARDDPRLADYVDLRAGATPHSVVIAEGLLAVEQLVSSPFTVRSVLVTPKRVDRLPPVDAPIYVADEALLRETVGFNLHRGVVAAADRPPPTDAGSVLADDGGPLLILEGVNDHENLGGLFRNARAFGAGGVLLDPTTADPLYRRAIRVSLGHVLHMPFARLTPWPDGLSALREAGVTTVALSPGAPDTVGEVVASLSGRVAFLLGTEGPGLSAAALTVADRAARIPMAADVDSLNVATAAAVALYALAASRR